LIRSKDKALEMLKHHKNKVKNQLNKNIKVIKSDRGGEYKVPIGESCFQNGIIYQTIDPYSP
jgi:hypothetical protein